MLDVDLLKTFVAIADTGSFTKAGALVGRTQAAISMQVKKLEEQVGKSLLLRESKLVSLTAEGQYLLPQARRILRMAEETLSALRSPDIVGAVRIGIPDDYALLYLPPILKSFCSAYPQVQVEVTCDMSRNLVPLVERGGVDVAITTCGHGGKENLILREEQFVWMTSSRHFVHEERPLPLAVFPQCQLHRGAMARMDDAGIDYRVAFTCANTGGLQAAVLSGLAVTALTSISLLPGMQLVPPEFNLPLPTPARIALETRDGERSPAVQKMIDHIVSAMREWDGTQVNLHQAA